MTISCFLLIVGLVTAILGLLTAAIVLLTAAIGLFVISLKATFWVVKLINELKRK